ncbi:MAG: DNA primase [Patescibacteria group bacterium]|nr:DNA primase [Patescibacteria group bacterium]
MEEIEIIKQKTDIVSLIGDYLNLKKAGRNYKSLCPFHNEKTPSFVVSPELQIFKCFGCGESGDVFSFLQKYEGMDFYEALVFLAKRCGVSLRDYKAKDKNFLFEINNLVAKFYNYILTRHPVGKYALNYLIKERCLSISTIQEFNLGYSPEQPNFFRNFFISKKKLKISDLERAGILYVKDNLFFDRFRGRVTFPLADFRGNIRGFSGRILPRDANKGLAKYINTPETEIYHKSELLYGIHISKEHIRNQKSAIVVEGELDMISSYQAGLRNVVAIKGSAITEDQSRILSRLCSKAILALDADLAGDSAARRGVNLLKEHGFEVFVAQFDKYKDPDEAARFEKKVLFEGVNNAVSVWDFLLNSIFAKYQSDSSFYTEEISKQIVAVLVDIEDLIVRSHYVGLVAKKLGISPDVINAQIENYVNFDRRKVLNSRQMAQLNVIKNLSKKGEKNLIEFWQERLFSLVVCYDLRDLLWFYENGVFTIPVLVKIIEFYNSQGNKNISYSDLVKILPPELADKAKDLGLVDVPENEEKLKKEAYQLALRIKRHNLNVEKENILKEIRKIEGSESVEGSDSRLLVLQKRFNEIIDKINNLALKK